MYIDIIAGWDCKIFSVYSYVSLLGYWELNVIELIRHERQMWIKLCGKNAYCILYTDKEELWELWDMQSILYTMCCIVCDWAGQYYNKIQKLW